MALDLTDRDIVNLLEKVDPFDSYQPGGRSFTPTAGYIVQNGGSPDLIIPEQEFTGHSSIVSKESRDYHAYNNQEIGNVVGIFFYKGRANPVQDQYVNSTAKDLHLPSGPHDVLVFDGMGNFNIEKTYSVEQLVK